MSSQEAKILSDFLLAPAALRDVLTLKEFTDILPKAYRTQPAVKDLYQELQRLRQEDIDTVRQNIADEVKKSKKLRREMAQARELDDRSAVAGLDSVALQMEEEVMPIRLSPQIALLTVNSFLATRGAIEPTRYRPFTPPLKTLARTSRPS
jgi:centromere-localized protein 2